MIIHLHPSENIPLNSFLHDHARSKLNSSEVTKDLLCDGFLRPVSSCFRLLWKLV